MIAQTASTGTGSTGTYPAAPGSTGRRVVAYLVAMLACLALAPWVDRLPWAGNVYTHTLHEATAAMLALGVAVIALLRFRSRPSDTFLLIGSAFAGTAFLDAYHALATSAFFAGRLQSAEL